MPSYSIYIAVSDDQLCKTWPVMQQLRPNLDEGSYIAAVQRMMCESTYQLAALESQGVVRAAAGYRIMEMLYCGRILYVDDLSVDAEVRSNGYGRAMLAWLMMRARDEGCAELHLDSGVQRGAAHKFYFREGLTINAYHFRCSV